MAGSSSAWERHSQHLRSPIAQTLLIALLYFIGARLGLAFFAAHPAALATVWPAAGVLLAGLLLTPKRSWPLLLSVAGLAGLLASLLAGSASLSALAFALAHLAEALLAASLLRRWLPAPLVMERLRDVFAFIGIAAIACNALTALLGAAVVQLSFGAPFWETWRVWFVADGLGMLLVAPLALSWLGAGQMRLQPPAAARVVEAAALVVALVLVGGVVFGGPGGTGFTLPYPLFPLLVWAALRFHMRGATLASLLLAVIVILGTAAGRGPFVAAAGSALDAILDAQQYLAVIVPCAYVIAALTAERANAFTSLGGANTTLETQIAERTDELVTLNRQLRAEVAERIEVERISRETEQAIRLQAQLLDSVQQAVIATDLQGQIIYWNRFAEALYGWTSAEVLGRPIVDVTPSEASVEQAQALMTSLQAGASWSGEFAVRRRDGSSFPALVTDSPVVDSAGQLIGIVGVSTDITARKGAEQALQEARVELEARVAARTGELAAVNARLLEELDERTRAETALAAQLRAQKTLADAAQHLLQPAASEQRPIVLRQTLAALRAGVGCRSAFLFQLLEQPEGRRCGRLIAIDTSATALPQGYADESEVPWLSFPPPLAAGLAEGWPVAGSAAELFGDSAPLARLLADWELQSVLIYPVQDGAGWWGLIGLGECGPRRWADSEFLLLRTAADLLRHVLHRWEAEGALRRSEQRYRSLVAAAPVGIFETDAAGACTFLNGRWCEIAGITPEAALGDGWVNALYPGDRAAAFAHWSAFAAGQGDYHRDLRYQHSDGRVRWTIADAVPLHDDEGAVIGYLGTVTDITERKQAELQLSASLQEKEILLREIHHRVKNNLQVISSLLWLQTRKVSDPAGIAALRESRQRVETMTLVHELLYRDGDLARIEAATYLRELTGHLLQLFGTDTARISLEVAASGTLELEHAVPCGLILTEAISNSLKYAFPEGRTGSIRVALEPAEAGALRLVVADDGVGLPTGVSEEGKRSLGMRLITNLARQLRGALQITGEGGVRIELTFPVSTTPARVAPA